jgi:hypothetical protein
MGEPFDHCPPGRIRQSRKRCTQFIHNRMVVDNLAISSVNFAIPEMWGQTERFPVFRRTEIGERPGCPRLPPGSYQR